MIFKKDDVAILTNCKKYTHLNGETAIIAGTMELRLDDDGSTIYGHELTLKIDGVPIFSALHQLQNTPEPRQDDRMNKAAWSSCAWSPYQNMDCMRLAKELVQVRKRTAALRRRLS